MDMGEHLGLKGKLALSFGIEYHLDRDLIMASDFLNEKALHLDKARRSLESARLWNELARQQGMVNELKTQRYEKLLKKHYDLSEIEAYAEKARREAEE